tara:strand:- start:229 stop:426 length:198 start_codon:yes stop_codon:yes gene_type:complete
MSEENPTNQNEMTIDMAFNNLVGIAREMKLSHKEHLVLEQSVQTVLEALNEAESEKEKSQEEKAV